MNATVKDRKLIIEINMQDPKLSASGRNFVVATTRGPWESPVEIAGKPVVIVLNAYVAADGSAEEEVEEDVPDLDDSEETKPGKRVKK